MGGFRGGFFRLNGLAVMSLDWRKCRECVGEGTSGLQAQLLQGERHLVPVFGCP